MEPAHLKLAVALGVGAAVGGAVAGGLMLRKLRNKCEQVEKAFVLVIELEFHKVEDRDRWLGLFRPLAAYCKAAEPGTLGYDVAVADNNEKKVLVYERYVSKAAHAEVHALSEEYAAFKEAAGKIKLAKKSGQSYIESNTGFIRCGC